MRRFCFLSVCVSLSLFLSLSLCFHLSVCFSVCLSLCLSVPLSLCLCVSVSPSVSVSPPISQLCLYLYSLSPPDTPATPQTVLPTGSGSRARGVGPGGPACILFPSGSWTEERSESVGTWRVKCMEHGSWDWLPAGSQGRGRDVDRRAGGTQNTSCDKMT